MSRLRVHHKINVHKAGQQFLEGLDIIVANKYFYVDFWAVYR